MTGDEIAVVGMAGRFPGAADLERFWRILCAQEHTVAEPTPGVTDFDPALFGLTAQEAARTDPQHRLLLEVAWEALEDAGQPAGCGAPVGVFTAASASQYQYAQLAAGRPPTPFQAADHLPAQVAYRLDLTGPAVATQTACSGALVAVCLAAASLADFRCDAALAGGVNVHLPAYSYGTEQLASPDGVCRAFDADGAGAGFASGAGAVVLRRLADAQADGDHVYAVLRGWAVTNDGAQRAGFAAPGVDGQAAAVAEALAVADTAPHEVGLVEAHGSGTRLGDAIEVAALRRVYGDAPGPVALGSVKTNLGYLDAACGIAGLCKAVLAVRHGTVPATLHLRRPNPEIDFGPFTVPTETRDWAAAGLPGDGTQASPRVAGVSAFGVGGTNAHAVLSQPPPRTSADLGTPADRPASDDGHPVALPLSAAGPQALAALAGRLRDTLTRHRPALADVAVTLTHGRARLSHRAVVAATDLDDAVRQLDRLADGTAQDPPAGGAQTVPEPPAGGRRIPLPTYPFVRQRCWLDEVVTAP